jgi:zinc/manganese transport system substrate-binding protein
MIHEIAGGLADTTSLVAANTDAHVFHPSPADAQRLAQAQFVAVNGLGFEGWIDRLIRASGYRGRVLVASDGIEARRVNGASDPHAWQSLPNAEKYVRNLTAALVEAMPAHARELKARADDYAARIRTLDAQARTLFGSIAPDQRRVITSHDAFGYFGQAYGIEFAAPQGWTTETEASAADIARVIRQVRAQRAKAIFVENMSDPRLLQTVARESGATIGGTLYSDALSAPGTSGETYLKMMAHNIGALAAALGAPAAQANLSQSGVRT